MVKNLVLENISVGFKLPQGVFYAVDDVSLSLPGGNFTAIIGESGCGKSVLGQAVLNILPSGVVKKGRVLYNGEQVKKILSAFGIIPQNPSESLNPVRKIGKQMQDILNVHNIADSDNSYKKQCLRLFGLQEAERVLAAYPHELSGGQRQRVGIARALIMNPKLIIADECISALDVSIQAQVVNLMKDIQQETGTAYLFIAHDLSMVKYISDRIGVLHLGHLLETGTTEEIFEHPIHPYTRSLLSAIPMPSPRRERQKKLLVYDPAIHDYSAEAPQWRELRPRHWVLCSAAEAEAWCREL